MLSNLSVQKLSLSGWCEPPLPNYKAADGYDIVQVHFMTRHGARTPLHVKSETSNDWACSHSEFKLGGSPSSTPTHVIVSEGKSILGGNCIFGQLIESGANSLKRLGAYVRRVYVDEQKFLPSHFIPSLFYFRSTATHRTIHSAVAFADGLFQGHAPIDVHVSDKMYDVWRRNTQLCPNLKKRLKDLKSKQPETPKTDDDYVASICSKNAAVSYKAEYFARAKAIVQSRVMADDRVFPLAFSFPLAEMINEATKRINGASRRRFYLWSCHHGNIFSYMGYLGHTLDRIAPYGSYVTTEILSERTSGNISVRVLYNGSPIPLGRFGDRYIIPFDEFRDFVANHIPSLDKECGYSPSESSLTFNPKEQ